MTQPRPPVQPRPTPSGTRVRVTPSTPSTPSHRDGVRDRDRVTPQHPNPVHHADDQIGHEQPGSRDLN